MRIVAHKHVLEACCERAAASVPQKDARQVLTNLQFIATENLVTVIASDLDVWVRTMSSLPHVERQGGALLPAKVFQDLLNKAPADDIIIDVEHSTASIRAGSTSWDLQLQNFASYPPVPSTNGVEFHDVSRAALLAAIESVRSFASASPSKANLCMVRVGAAKGVESVSHAIASDGTRFREAVLTGSFPDFQIPNGAVSPLLRTLRAYDVSDAQIGQSETHTIVKVDGDAFISARLAVEFPDVVFKQLFLRPVVGNNQRFSVSKKQLQDAIARVRITADHETAAIQLELTFNQVTVTSKNRNGDTASESVVATWDEPDRVLSVSHKLLSSLIDSVKSDILVFKLGSIKNAKSHIVLEDGDVTSTLVQMAADW